MAKQELRQAINKVDISGVVKEHKLATGKGDSGKYINGSLVIKAGEFTELSVKVFVSELNKQGKEKKSYETLNKILKGEVKTMAEVSEDEAVKVRIWGKDDFVPHFKEEIFAAEGASDVVTNIVVDLGFGNVTISDKIKPEDYEAKFDVEMFVESINEEIDKKTEEETGRVIVKGWIPVYGGSVIPLDVKFGLVTDDEGNEFDFAEDIRSSVDPETTMNFWGDIDFKSIVEKTSKGGSLGKAKVDKKTTYIHDLIGIGAEYVDDDKAYDIEDIKQARVQRENAKDEAKNKNKDGKKTTKGSGVTNRGSSRPVRNTQKPVSKPVKDNSVEDDEDELPF